METALQRTGIAGLPVPSFIKPNDTRGTENITNADIKPPALKLAQAMSPEVKRSESEYLEGLREGSLFNSISREIYGEDAVHLCIVNFLGTRNIEFDPNDRKVVLDGNVPDNDPRTQFTMVIENGTTVRKKPRATVFKDFLVLLLHGQPDGNGGWKSNRTPELVTLSLKSTQLKKATRLLTQLRTSKLPSFAHLIEAEPVPERKGANSWYGWKLEPVGYVTEAQYNLAAETYDQLVGKKIDLELEGDPEPAAVDEDIPF